MTMRVLGLTGALVGTVAFVSITGQEAGSARSTTPAQAQTSRAAADEITVTGCIQREEEYRRSSGAGRGGAANTGLGLGNEFVLMNASTAATAGSATAPTTGAVPPSATGTAGTTARGTAYELSGTNEGRAAAYVGKRVEITGKLKPADAGTVTGGPTANAPLSQDLKLRELDVSSIREASGSCTAP